MFYKKKVLPEEGEYILCTVKKILFHSVFVVLDEYEGKEGMIHISEISPGRIRNIRDYVKEGKKLICKVLRVKHDRGQVDLSLRRVSIAMRKKKNTEVKQEQKAEKIMEIVAHKLKIDVKKLYEDFGNKLWEEYGGLNPFFQEVIAGETSLKDVVPEKYTNILEEVIKEKIKPRTYTIERNLELQSKASNGIELIKEALKKAKDLSKGKDYELIISYVSAPKYLIKITAYDHKIVDKAMEEVTSTAIKFIESNDGRGEVKKE
ncbi:MAG: translation initiation factor IF-2 subunit alpha [Nanoarchaeota archaeon]|nr:translation initiation factor IF-2 subunit alpha [Nanoarchaeota archaeon]MCG2718823.1 translation initiation factor IF-2 subunit alpha [Nanoarchaeota archaeon]